MRPLPDHPQSKRYNAFCMSVNCYRSRDATAGEARVTFFTTVVQFLLAHVCLQ
jgi:hypothetical protein